MSGLRYLTILSVLISSFCFKASIFPLSSKTVLVDNFDKGVFSTLLGGSIGSKSNPPGVCALEFINRDGLTFGNSGSSLEASFDVKNRDSFVFFWIKLAGEDNLGIKNTGYLKDCNYISFWIRGDVTGENISLELHEDLNSDRRFDVKDDFISTVSLNNFIKDETSNEWRKVVIPLSAFRGINNLTGVLELIFVFKNSNKGKNSGTIYIDELLFGHSDRLYAVGKKSIRSNKPETDTLSANGNKHPYKNFFGRTVRFFVNITGKTAIRLNKPKIDTFRINNNKISDTDVIEGVVELSINCDSILENPAIESVRFEYSRDGLNWTIIGFDYDTADNRYRVNFDTFALARDQRYYLRAMSTYTDGSESKTDKAGPVSIKELSDEEFLLKIEERAFNFFRDNQSRITGLFLDNNHDAYSSIASTGFGLAALAIGAKNGWIGKEEASARVHKAINTFLTDPQNKSRILAEGKDGFCHFLEADTAKRFGDCEISSIDNAILVSGAIVSGEYFGGDVKEAADRLCSSIKWDKFLDNTSGEHKNQFYMGWFPDGKFLDSWWDYYTDEVILISLLAVGSPNHKVAPGVFYSFKRETAAYAKGEPFIVSWHGALFTYQYAQAFFNFRGLVDSEGVDWWKNSVSATLANRNFCIDNSYRYRTFGPYTWGITSMRLPYEYVMHHGVSPCGSKSPLFDGTVSPTGPAGSMPFTPFVSLDSLRYMLYWYPELWGEYGIKDSFNLDTGYYPGIYYGLGEGLILMMIENARTSFVWDTFMKNIYMQRALELAGLRVVKNEELPNAGFDGDGFLKAVKEATSNDRFSEIFNKVCNTAKTQPQFRNFIDGVNDYIFSIDVKAKTRYLKYWIAYSYVKEIENLKRDPTLESFRLYLKYKEVYYEKAINLINQLSKEDASGELKVNLLFMRLLIDIGSFRFSNIDKSLKEIAVMLSDYSDKYSVNISKLDEFFNEFKSIGLEEYALRLKSEFIKASDKEASLIVLDRLQQEAQATFNMRDYETSSGLYALYFDAKMAKNAGNPKEELKELADRFYSANKWRYARQFYSKLLDIKNNNLANYAHFKIAKTFEAEAVIENAQAEYEILIKSPLRDEWSDNAYLELAKTYYTNAFNDPEYSIKKIKALIDQYPKNSSTARIKIYLAELYYIKKDLAKSLDEYRLILKEYPHDPLASLVEESMKKIEKEL
jgi:ribosomal protein S8